MGLLPESSASIVRAWLSSGILLALSFATIAAISLTPRADAEAVAAVFPLWWTEQQTFFAAASAGASIIRTSNIAAIVIVQPAHHDGMKRLHDAGVWVSLDPQALDACMTVSKFPKAEGLRT